METRFGALTSRGMRITMYWFVVILAVILDQSTKAAARELLADGPLVMIPGVINLIHVENTGAAFSFGEGATVLFVVIAVLCIAASTFAVWTIPDIPYRLVLPLGLLAGGGMGNMVDRILTGSVTDFIATAFISFPVFNVADICVTIGAVLSLVFFWRWDDRNEPVRLDGQDDA